MKKYLSIGLTLCAAGALCSGCLGGPKQTPVPTAHIDLEVAGQKASISDPKQLFVTNLTFKVENTNGCKAELTIGGLTANNDTNVVAAGYAGYADVVNATGNQVNAAMKTGADIAGKFVGSAVGAAK